MWFGDLHEVINRGKRAIEVDWTAFNYGAIVGIVPWILMFISIGRLFLEENDSNIPWWVWAFVAEYFALFWVFPYTMWAQYSERGHYENALYPLLDNGGYLKGERRY
jgi:hypothetical protein